MNHLPGYYTLNTSMIPRKSPAAQRKAGDCDVKPAQSGAGKAAAAPAAKTAETAGRLSRKGKPVFRLPPARQGLQKIRKPGSCRPFHGPRLKTAMRDSQPGDL